MHYFAAGLANPAPIIQTFYVEETVSQHVRLDGVVTMVDAKHVLRHIEEVKPEGVTNEAVEQIAYADRIILNKVWHLRPGTSQSDTCTVYFSTLVSEFCVCCLRQTDLVNDAEVDELVQTIKVCSTHWFRVTIGQC